MLEILRAVRDWSLLDPDKDGVIDLDGIQERIRSSEEELQVTDDLIMEFLTPTLSVELFFSGGVLVDAYPISDRDVFIHGISVLVEIEGSLFPSLLNIKVMEVTS